MEGLLGSRGGVERELRVFDVAIGRECNWIDEGYKRFEEYRM